MNVCHLVTEIYVQPGWCLKHLFSPHVCFSFEWICLCECLCGYISANFGKNKLSMLPASVLWLSWTTQYASLINVLSKSCQCVLEQLKTLFCFCSYSVHFFFTSTNTPSSLSSGAQTSSFFFFKYTPYLPLYIFE